MAENSGASTPSYEDSLCEGDSSVSWSPGNELCKAMNFIITCCTL